MEIKWDVISFPSLYKMCSSFLFAEEINVIRLEQPDTNLK